MTGDDADRAGPVIGLAWPRPDYVEALRVAGARPLVLTPTDDPMPAALDRCDGLLLTGGADVDPAHYGEEKHDSVQTDAERDTYELALARGALARNMPIFAICRGAQLLNVAAGGTLVQDIPSQVATTVSHKKPQSDTEIVHDVVVAPGTQLANALALSPATLQFGVNSRHHQSVKSVAPGFIASAHAPDGVVEAIERPGGAFCVAVQWHPENFWRTGEFNDLFKALVNSARHRPGSADARC